MESFEANRNPLINQENFLRIREAIGSLPDGMPTYDMVKLEVDALFPNAPEEQRDQLTEAYLDDEERTADDADKDAGL